MIKFEYSSELIYYFNTLDEFEYLSVKFSHNLHTCVCGKETTNLEGNIVTKDNVSGELSIHGAGSNRNMPGCKIFRSGIRRPTVASGANHHNAMFGGMEGSDGNTILEKRGGRATEREGEDIDAVVDGEVEGCQDIGVEALVAGDGGPADLVGCHTCHW